MARDSRLSRHGHLWSLPDGTGLHAPLGSLVVDGETGRLCCHLCGEWFRALGVHVRVHGYTASTYRTAMRLPPARVLIADGRPRALVSRSRAGKRAPTRGPDEMAKNGSLLTGSAATHPQPPEAGMAGGVHAHALDRADDIRVPGTPIGASTGRGGQRQSHRVPGGQQGQIPAT